MSDAPQPEPSPAQGDPAAEEIRFEQAIDDLEALIDRIESGEVGLEESLKCYERGMKLVGQCRGILDAAEQRIAELTVDKDGNLQANGADDGE